MSFTPPPTLYVVFAEADGREPLAIFRTADVARRWAETLARDFRRRYIVVGYGVGAEPPVEIEPPPVAATGSNGQHRPGSQHAAKTKIVTGRDGRGRRDGDRLTERGR